MRLLVVEPWFVGRIWLLQKMMGTRDWLVISPLEDITGYRYTQVVFFQQWDHGLHGMLDAKCEWLKKLRRNQTGDKAPIRV